MAAGSKWTWEKGVALVLFYAIASALIFWGFGWSPAKDFATSSAEAFGLGLIAMVAIWLVLLAMAVPVFFLPRILSSRRGKRLR